MGQLRHLVRRFFDVLTSRPLTPEEQLRAAALLRAGERELFWRQQVADQRHAVSAVDVVVAARPGRTDLARAALLHDVGKRHARLGVPGRTLASIVELLRLPAPGRLGRYLDHGAIGAAELRAAGAEAVVVDFALWHHGEQPGTIQSDDWQVLADADDV
jgi:putative nucleotidyltransferase with HDIG domain